MAWISNELIFANSLIFEHSTRCATFVQRIFDDLARELPDQIILEKQIEVPVMMKMPSIPQISAPSQPKRALNPSPSPTRTAKSPVRKKAAMQRPITAPSFRRPLNEVSGNPQPLKVAQQKGNPDLSYNMDRTDSSITTSRGSRSSSRSPQRSRAQSPARSPARSPGRSPVRYPKIDSLSSSPTKPKAPRVQAAPPTTSAALARLMIPTVSSLQHSSGSGIADSSSTPKSTGAMSLRINVKNQSPGRATFKAPQNPGSATPTTAKNTPEPKANNLFLSGGGASAIPRVVPSKIPISANSQTGTADRTLPSGYSTTTPFRVGLKKPLRAPAPSPGQMTLPDISDNDSSGQSLLRSWAATPEIRRQISSQTGLDPNTVFGGMGRLDIDKIFAKPQVLRRGRTSSAAWEHDGLTIKERKEFANEMGFAKDQ